MDLVSVIIPTYNCSKYVGDAIRSIQKQTYPNIEVIVVDDGSTDETANILAEFGPAISKLTHPAQLGSSSARFSGIKVATGEWITFLDADDKMSPYAIERCVNQGSGCDIVQMKISQISRKNNFKIPFKQKYDTKNAIKSLCGNHQLFPVQCWGKLYRANFLKPLISEISTELPFWGEDRLFNLTLFINNPKISICENAEYYYFWGGATTIPTDRSNEYANIQSLIKSQLTAHSYLTFELEKEINSQLVKLLRYNTRQLINLGIDKKKIISGLTSILYSPDWCDLKISPSKIYAKERKSLSRILKKVVTKFF